MRVVEIAEKLALGFRRAETDVDLEVFRDFEEVRGRSEGMREWLAIAAMAKNNRPAHAAASEGLSPSFSIALPFYWDYNF